MLSHFQEIYGNSEALTEDFSVYQLAESSGQYQFFTVRDPGGKLVGYAGLFLRPHPHTKNYLSAQYDVLYLDKTYRGVGLGASFIAYCDDKVKALGAKAVYQTVPIGADFSGLLFGLGYAQVERVMKRGL